MMQQSPGWQPKEPREPAEVQEKSKAPSESSFLDDYIKKLQGARSIKPGDYATAGAVGQTINDNASYYT